MFVFQSLQLLHDDGYITWITYGNNICIHLAESAFIARLARPHTAEFKIKSVCQEALDDTEMAAFKILAQSEQDIINNDQSVLDAFNFLWSNSF